MIQNLREKWKNKLTKIRKIMKLYFLFPDTNNSHTAMNGGIFQDAVTSDKFSTYCFAKDSEILQDTVEHVQLTLVSLLFVFSLKK